MSSDENKYVYIITLPLIVMVSFLGGRYTGRHLPTSDTIRVDSVVIRDTVFTEIHDTLPREKGEAIVKYITIPGDTLFGGNVTLPVVQKTYSDDSVYTAYVSGPKYDDYPKLDSISIRHHTITNTVIKEITIQKPPNRWRFDIQAGYGYGLSSRRVEPYIGIGVSYSLFK